MLPVCRLIPSGTPVGSGAGFSAATSFRIRRPLYVSLQLVPGHNLCISSRYLMCELFLYSTKYFLFFSLLFTTGIFHLRTGLWLAPFDVSYSVCVCVYVSRSILDRPEHRLCVIPYLREQQFCINQVIQMAFGMS